MNASFASRASIIMVLVATASLPGAATAQYRLPTIVSSVQADSLHEAAVELRTAGRWRIACAITLRCGKPARRRASSARWWKARPRCHSDAGSEAASH